MTDHAAKQAAYEAKRRAVTNRPAPYQKAFRIYLPDNVEVMERADTLAKAAAAHPTAWRVEEMDKAGFW